MKNSRRSELEILNHFPIVMRRGGAGYIQYIHGDKIKIVQPQLNIEK